MANLHMPARQASALCELKQDPDCALLAVASGFYSRDESDWLYQCLQQQQQWPDNHYEVAGRRFQLPRQQTWHADSGIVYSYSNNLLQTRPWTPLLSSIRRRVEDFLATQFNAVLVNYYRNGDDYVGWHSDDEKEMGSAPVIASLSLGAARRFEIRDIPARADIDEPVRHHIGLESGDLVVMKAGFQNRWQHQVPAQPEVAHGRINLTFRRVLPPGLELV